MFERISAGLTLAAAVSLVTALALKGLGFSTDPWWTDISLIGLHTLFPICGILLVVEALKKKQVLHLILVLLPLLAFAGALGLALVRLPLPAPALVGFDFYLILGLTVYLTQSFPAKAERPRTIHF